LLLEEYELDLTVEEVAWRYKARGRKRRGRKTIPQQVINNSAAVQQER
jgi:hypothetical protein